MMNTAVSHARHHSEWRVSEAARAAATLDIDAHIDNLNQTGNCCYCTS